MRNKKLFLALCGALFIGLVSCEEKQPETRLVDNNLKNSIQLVSTTTTYKNGKIDVEVIAKAYEGGKVVKTDTLKLNDLKASPLYVTVLSKQAKEVEKPMIKDSVKVTTKDTIKPEKKDSLITSTNHKH